MTAGGARGARACLQLAIAVVLLAATLASNAASPPAKQLIAVSAAAPAMELKDLSGKVHRLADYRGKVVLVNFWATWCEPCRDEMPSMQTLKHRAEKAAGGDFVVLAVNYAENAARIEQFLQKQPFDFTILLDPFSEVWRAWTPGVLPASFLVGRDGRLRYRAIGEIDWAGAAAQAAVMDLLKEKG